MRKLSVLFVGLLVLHLVSACSSENISTKNDMSDYRPMIYVQNSLYGETAEVVNTLPKEAVSIGDIEKNVPQTEPMIQENFTSNCLPIGSEIFYKEADASMIYVKLSNGEYSVYTAIK